MENTCVEIELINEADEALAHNGYLKDGNIKKLHVKATIETKGFSCVINEHLQAYLKLPVINKRKIQLGEGIIECEIAGMLTIHFNNKKTTCSALILPGNTNIQISKTQWLIMNSETVRLPAVFRN